MLTLLIVGRTGNGRSSVCNTILGNDSSDQRNPQKHVTRPVVDTVVNGATKKIAVVDSVGIGDTHFSDLRSIRSLTISAFKDMTLCIEQEKEDNTTENVVALSSIHNPEMTHAHIDSSEQDNTSSIKEHQEQESQTKKKELADTFAPMASDQHVLQGNETLSTGKAFDAFIFVMKFGIRFTKQERDAVLVAKSIYGEKIFKNWGILVFSYGDNFEYEGRGRETFIDWCKQQTGDIRKLFQEVDYRCVLFDNRSNRFKQRTDSNTIEEQRNDLLTQLYKLRSKKYNINDFEKNLLKRSEHLYQELMKQFNEFLLASSTCKISLRSNMKQSVSEFRQYLMDEKTEWLRVKYIDLLNSYLSYLDSRIQELEEVNKNIETKGCVLS